MRPQWFRRIGLWMAGVIRPSDLSEENALALVLWFHHTGLPRIPPGIIALRKQAEVVPNTGQYL